MSMESTPSEQLAMAQHPDIMALRERYERAAETPQASAIEGLTFMAGAYAAISAWVVGFDGSSPRLTASNLVVGIAVALLAFGYATFYGRTHVLAWVAPVLGAWLIVAPWIVERGTDRDNAMVWSNVIVGACVVLLGLGITVLARLRPQPRVHRRP